MDWADFDEAEELSVIDDSTLKITKTDGYSSPGELIRYRFDNKNNVISLKYTGHTMLTFEEAQSKGWFS